MTLAVPGCSGSEGICVGPAKDTPIWWRSTRTAFLPPAEWRVPDFVLSACFIVHVCALDTVLDTPDY